MDRATIRPFQLYPAAYDPHTLYPMSENNRRRVSECIWFIQ